MQAQLVGDGEVVDGQVERFVAVARLLEPLGDGESLYVADALFLGQKALEPFAWQELGQVVGAGTVGEVQALVQVVLGDVGADEPQLGAAFGAGAAPVDVDPAGHAADDGAVALAGALDDDAAGAAPRRAVVVDVLREVAARVDAPGADGDGPGAAGVLERGGAQRIQPLPDAAGLGGQLGRVAVDHLVVDDGVLHAGSPGFDLRLDAVVLRVGGHGENQRPVGDDAAGQVGRAGYQRINGGGGLAVVVADGQAGVAVDLEAAVIALLRAGQGAGVLSGQLDPGDAAGRGVEGVDVEADGFAIAGRCGDPASLAAHGFVGQHGVLGAFLDLAAAAGTDEPGAGDAVGFGVVVVVEVLLHQLVQVAAVRTRHVVALLDALFVQGVDLAGASDGRAADVVGLADAFVGGGAGLGQLDRVALVVDGHLHAVDFVGEDIARGDFGQVGGGAGGGDVEGAAVEFLAVDGVAGVAAARAGDLAADGGAAVDGLADAGGQALGELVGRLQRENVGGGTIDPAHGGVDEDLRLEHLRRGAHDHAGARVAR